MRTPLASKSLALLLALTLTGMPTPGWAAGTVSPATYDRLLQVYRLVEEGRYGQALELLGSVRAAKARSYERAVILQTYGYVYAEKQEYERAIEAFTQCLDLDALPESATKGLLYGLVQLQASIGRYTEAAGSLKRWFALEDRPTPEANALAGWIYAQVGGHDQAIDYLRKAIAEAKTPNDGWYQQLLWVYFETDNYQQAAGLLEGLVGRLPHRKEYWLQLSGAYQALGEDRRAVAVMELAFQRGLLTEEQELVNLARYYLYLGVPYKAGLLLAHGLSSGAISHRTESWRLLGDAWLSARELRLALDALDRGLAEAPAGDLQLRRAQIATELWDWRLVVEAVEAALADADLEHPGTAYLLGGIALYHQDKHGEALVMLQNAKAFEGSRRDAEQWLNYLAHLVKSQDAGSSAFP